MKTNLKGYSDSELYDWVQNDECLYNEFYNLCRYDRWTEFVSLLDEYFDYTDEQLAELKKEWDSEHIAANS